MPNPFNQQVIDEFRARHGQVGGYFEGARLILLTTTGARTSTDIWRPSSSRSHSSCSLVASRSGSPIYAEVPFRCKWAMASGSSSPNRRRISATVT